MYLNGQGVLQDYVKAHMWINIAVANGPDVFRSEKRFYEIMMTPSQIEKAQEMARECEAKNYKDC